MAIQTQFEILFRTAQIFRSNVEKKEEKAFELFSKAASELRGQVYERLYEKMTFTHVYWGCGEHAFHDQNGLSSSPELKAQAIEAQLTAMVAAMKLKGAPNLKDVYYFLGSVAECMVSCPEEGMRLFNNLPEELRKDVYKELSWLLPFDEQIDIKTAEEAFHDKNGLTSLPSLKALAIECCMLRNVRDLFSQKTDHALAIDLFKRIRSIHQSEVYAQFSWLIDGISHLPIEPIFQTAQADPLYQEKKGEAVEKYLAQFQKAKRSRILKWCEVKLVVAAHPVGEKERKETADAAQLVQKLVRTEPAMTVRTAAEEQFALGQIFEDDPFQSLAERSFTERFCNVNGAKLLIYNQFYFNITCGTQRFSQQRLVSCGCAEDRELLFLDPTSSPEIELHYDRFLHTLSAGMTTEEILSQLKEYLRSHMFTCKKPQIEAVRAYNAAISAISARVARHKDHLDWKIPMIPIDDYVRQGIGLDRHHALVACYFIDRLLTEDHPLLDGTVQFMKCNLPDDGAHIVTTFIPKRQGADPQQRSWKQHQESPPEKWLLDSYRNVLVNFAKPEDRIALRQHAIPMDQVVKRSSPAAAKNGQPLSS